MTWSSNIEWKSGICGVVFWGKLYSSVLSLLGDSVVL